jgi:hypothetical protein
MGHRQLPLSDQRGRALRSRQAFATDDEQACHVSPAWLPQVAYCDSALRVAMIVLSRGRRRWRTGGRGQPPSQLG